MSRLRANAQAYLALRRGLGYGLEAQEFMLRRFCSFMEQRRETRITTALALLWARSATTAQPEQWARRLGVVRGFARHLHGIDPRTEVPPPGLLPQRFKRCAPYVYSNLEIARLLASARRLPSRSRWRGATMATLIGLLAVTGLRISEALALDVPDDVDLQQGLLQIRCTKFGKSRLVPIHASTAEALRRYLRLLARLRPLRTTPALFIGEQGRRATCWAVRRSFNQVTRQIGLRAVGAHRGPRLHDLRHRFAVTTLLHWYRRGLDVDRRLPRLATFLGHGHVTDTYWYLSAVPELLRWAAHRVETARVELP